MTDEELRNKPSPKTFDNTMRCQYRSCARKMYWFLRGADYLSTPPYFVFGQAWQVMIESWYDPQVEKDWTSEQIVKHSERAIQAGIKHWDDMGCMGAKNDTKENLVKLFKQYMKTYLFEQFKVLGVEKGWEWPIKGTEYYLGGSLDGYIEWEPHGLLILENKTTGTYLTDAYLAQWDYSSQIDQYIWYLTQLLGEEVFGCLMNMATKRIAVRKPIEEQSLFSRDLQKRDEYDLEEFLDEVMLDIADIEREWERWKWPKTVNTIECVGGIGKSPCLFRPVCKAKMLFTKVDPTTFEGIIWRGEDWEPWKRG